MKLTRTRVILLATAVFLVGLLVKFPASVGASIVGNFLPGFQAGNASGTVWSGRIENARYGTRGVDTFEWQLQPLNLLLLEAAADVDIRKGRSDLSAGIVVAPGGDIEISALRGTVDIASIEKLGLMPSNLARGDVLLDIGQLRLEGGKVVAAEGRAQLTGLRSRMLPGVALGDYAGTLENADEGIRLVFRDANAPLELQGTATLNPAGNYRTEGTIRPTSETPQQLQNGMKFLGQPDSSGRYRFSFSGRL